jgi:hypothetical protein
VLSATACALAEVGVFMALASSMAAMGNSLVDVPLGTWGAFMVIAIEFFRPQARVQQWLAITPQVVAWGRMAG